MVLLHNDVDMPFPKPGQDPYPAAQLAQLLRRHPKTTVIWAHCGLGRIVHPVKDHIGILERALSNPELPNLHMDISWDEVAKYLVATPETTQAAADLINRHPDRFLFGTDEVAPTEQAKYLKVYDMYAPLFAKLTPEASEKLRKGNYERLFDTARDASPGVGKGKPEMNQEGIVRRHGSRRCCSRPRRSRVRAQPTEWRAPSPRRRRPRQRRRRTPPPSPTTSPASTSTASPCSTWATSRSRTTRTGSTWCGRPSCRRSRTSSARTATSSPACARAGWA